MIFSEMAGLNTNRKQNSSDKKYKIKFVSFCFFPLLCCFAVLFFFIEIEILSN